MENQKHGNQDNSNAQKASEPATSHINARVTPTNKAGWVKQAQRENLKLTEWIVKTLNAANGDTK